MQISKHILKRLSQRMTATRVSEPTREYVNNIPGAVLLEFGSNGCGYCQAAQEVILHEIDSFMDVDHIRIEDGHGRRLGRSFNVKSWPTLIFMKDGKELDRLVMQIDSQQLRSRLQSISTGELDCLIERESSQLITL